MDSKKISGPDWERVIGMHSLFTRINDSVLNRYMEITPQEVVDMILDDPYGTTCDGITTLYPVVHCPDEYFVRMQWYGGSSEYDLNLDAMKPGKGGFLKHATTLTEPEIFPDISDLMVDSDIEAVQWVESMKTALVVPTINVKGEAATTIMFSEEVDGFDAEVIKANVFMTYATTNIILTWIHRVDALKSCDALDSELKSIGKIQRSFLPSELPNSERFSWATYYATSTRAGGDYFDFFPLPNQYLGIIIADVAGHGSPAAIVMAMTRLLLHSYPGDINPPAEVLEHLNDRLIKNLMPGKFVTAFYGVLDERSGRLDYSNAGHCYPYIYRAAEGALETIKTESGLPLGVMTDGMYVHKSLALSPGDAVLFYTDGIIEATAASGEMYGEERLRSIMLENCTASPEDFKKALLDDIDAFLKDEPIKDDITFVILRAEDDRG